MTEREYLYPKTRRWPKSLKPGYPAPHAVKVTGGKTRIYIAGEVSTDEMGNIVGPGDIRTQIRQVMENLKKDLEAAGASLSDVVVIHAYFRDMRDMEALRAVRNEYWPNKKIPAQTCIGVTGLADKELLLEIEAIAELG